MTGERRTQRAGTAAELRPVLRGRSAGAMSRAATLVLAILILAAGGGITWAILHFEPTAQRSPSTRETAMLVETTRGERGTFRPRIVAMGTVLPSRDIVLRPRVEGEIVALSDDLTPGGFVDEGAVLLRLDPADYENAVAQRRSALLQAEAALALERGRQSSAQLEFELLGEEIPEEERALVLREPQLAAARAEVEGARSEVDLAELLLARTEIRAPFDAHVITRGVNLGSQVDPNTTIARLVGIHTYWVEVTVPRSELTWLRFPRDANGAAGAPARIRDRSAWRADQVRTGRLHELIGALEERTRMARVIVEVDDPLARTEDSPEVPVLMIGAYVEVSIDGRPIEDCVKLPREYERQNGTVWVMADGVLDVRSVDVAFRDETAIYVVDGLTETDDVVTTNLSTVIDGARLRTEGDAESGGTDAAPDAGGSGS